MMPENIPDTESENIKPKKSHKKIIFIAAGFLVLFCIVVVAIYVQAAATLTVPARSFPTGTMSTLNDIFAKISDSTAAVTGHFLYPNGTIYNKTASAIYSLIPANNKICSGTLGGTATCYHMTACGAGGTMCDSDAGYWCAQDGTCESACSNGIQSENAHCPLAHPYCGGDGICGDGAPGFNCHDNASSFYRDELCVASNCSTLDGRCGGPGAVCSQPSMCLYNVCTGGFCVAGTGGDPCIFNADCASNNCSGGFCGGSACTQNSDCNMSGGYCDTNSGTCTNGLPGAGCGQDSDCADSSGPSAPSHPCNLADHICGSNGAECYYDQGAVQCVSGICNGNGICIASKFSTACFVGSGDNYCDAIEGVKCGQDNFCGTTGASCNNDDTQCLHGNCINLNSGGAMCGWSGTACTANGDCVNNNCYNGYCGIAGASCGTGMDCWTGYCVNSVCTDGHIGTACLTGADCSAIDGAYDCDTYATHTCTDGGTSAQCTDNNDCTNGGTGTCSSHNHYCVQRAIGNDCGQNSECSSGYCNTTIGANVCTDGDYNAGCEQHDQCISDVCTGGHCLSIITHTCYSNADCASNYCNTYNDQCIDGSYGSTCGADTDCSGGHCVSMNHTCSNGAPGDPCSTAGGPSSECVSNSCNMSYQCD